MKVIIDIPEKTISHIRSDYGHGCKAIFDEDRDKIVDAIYHGIPLDKVKAEIKKLRSHSARFRTSDGRVVYVDSQDILDVLDNIYKAESEEE